MTCYPTQLFLHTGECQLLSSAPTVTHNTVARLGVGAALGAHGWL